MSDDPVVAYVVLCHHKAPQVLRLARTIRRLSPRARVLIRHNQPSGYIDAEPARAAGADLLVSSLPTRWGGWSLVSATIEAFEDARRRYDPDWMVLISGQDYPIRRLHEWERELLTGDHDAVVPAERLGEGRFGLRPREARDGLVMRYTHRWYRLPQLGVVPRLPRRLVRVVRAVWYRYIYDLQALVTLNELPRGQGWMLGIRRHRVPWTPGIASYKGEQWLALSRRALAASLDGERARSWQRFFATTLVPDEAYFPTALINDRAIRVNRSRVSWLRWEEDVTKPHPVTLDRATLAEAVASGAPFARKFDEDAAPGLLDVVDETILNLQPVA
ncbi:MAG TPA: beta-1,6-N-acetylglucosaminyltransferase [Solirubrobacteraceae bacterium]|nr:beta-1,6-N-acetylglucosaminyltransferase [Solirubrobacteraceae bacterium]